MDKRFFINLFGNIFSFIIAFLVSIWLTPFIINKLGSEAYGFIPLSQSLVDYMALISLALNGMLQRFFTISVKSSDMKNAKSYFNTSLFANIFIAPILVILVIISTFYIDKILNVPAEILIDVQITFLIFGMSFIINMIFNSFGMAFFCENRLELNSIGNVITVAVRAIILVIVLNLFTPHIWIVGIGAIIPSIILVFYNYYYFKKLLPEINISYKFFDFSKLKELLSAGIWNSINYIGAILYLRIDMLVANLLLGSKIAGEFSAVLVWSNLLRGISTTITSVFSPTMMKLYAEDKIDEFIRYSNFSVRISGFILAIPIGIIFSFSESILNIWLGNDFIKYSLLLKLMVVHLPINLSVQSLFAVFMTKNKMRTPAIVTIIMGLINMVIAVIFVKYLNWGIYGITVAGGIMLMAKNLIFTPIYCAKITDQKWNVYFKGVISPLLGLLFITIICNVVNYYIEISDWYSLIIAGLIASSVYFMISYLILFRKDEKESIHKIIMWVKDNYIKKEK